MSTPDWNWYATRELSSILTREGLRCPLCDVVTQDIEFCDGGDFSTFLCGQCGGNFAPAQYYAAQRRPPKTGLSTLYRPVGSRELAKIAATGYRQFPPRLEWQPIFYPVLNFDYAAHIAREWNSKDPNHDFVGFVTRFQINNSFLCNYEIQTVGDQQSVEYWIPAEELASFNVNIQGPIEVITEFRNGQLV
jgi:hypothetical protein